MIFQLLWPKGKGEHVEVVGEGDGGVLVLQRCNPSHAHWVTFPGEEGDVGWMPSILLQKTTRRKNAL